MMPDEIHQQPFLVAYPNLAAWVTRIGWIEIGQDDYSRSSVRVLNSGGMVWESKGKYAHVDAALQAADAAIAIWLQDNDFEK